MSVPRHAKEQWFTEVLSKVLELHITLCLVGVKSELSECLNFVKIYGIWHIFDLN